MAAPVLKGELSASLKGWPGAHTCPTLVIQIMISQLIIGYRTWAITRRSKELGIFLIVFGTVITGLEWFSNVDGRTATQDDVSVSHIVPPAISDGNCFY